jgi:hypothetical protein
MSNINYLSINENFPVPGQDNDTQVFRDNFDTIKQSLRVAGEEVSDLQDNAARTDVDNDFNNKIIQRAVLQDVTNRKLEGGSINNVTHTIDFQNGGYQVFSFAQNVTISFQNFPNSTSTPEAVGKVTLELYSSQEGSSVDIAFNTVGGTVLKKSSNFPGTLSVDSALAGGTNNPVIIEVWAHSSDKIFLNYLGQFS